MSLRAPTSLSTRGLDACSARCRPGRKNRLRRQRPRKVWEELDAAGQVADRLDRRPIRLHVVHRFEMEHLLARAGFAVTALYGDFLRGEFQDESSDMIWVARSVHAR